MASTPVCRCRVLYLGSAVPHVTKDGLHGIQEPLRELYPEEGLNGAKGIDSWLSVWSNGLLLENVDEKRKRVTRFFPIDSLHYCAAVRHVTIPGVQPEAPINSEVVNNPAVVHQRFLPLDSPFARIPSPSNPPLFACILRRTSGIKVLECHAFVCKKEMAANALVRCCFHAYADNTFAKQLESGSSIYGTVPNNNNNNQNNGENNGGQIGGVNPIQKVEQWRAYIPPSKDDVDGHLRDSEVVSIYDSNDNHKVWTGTLKDHLNGQNNAGQPTDSDNEHNSTYGDYISSTLRSVKSTNGTLSNGNKTSSRPRQLTTPSNPPPPPPTQILNESELNGKDKKSKRNSNVKHFSQNGNGGKRWHSSEFRPMWPAPHYMPPQMIQNGGMFLSAPPPPPPSRSPQMMPILMAPPGHPIPPPPGAIMNGKMSKSTLQRSKNGSDEPIYVPVNGRPFVNGGNQLYHPCGFPYAEDPNAYFLMGPGPMAPTPLPQAPGTPTANGGSRSPTPTKYKKKDKTSNSDSETKYNTGIYRKKGHLNERAFSYSIRQEHRSRSHSSLATLSFNADVNGQHHSDDEKQLKSNKNGEHSYKNGNNGMIKKEKSKSNLNLSQQKSMTKHAKNGTKNDSGLSSDSSLGGHVISNGNSKVSNGKKYGVKNGHQRSEMDIKDLSLSDGEMHEEYSTTKAKNKQMNKKIAASSNNLKMAANKKR
ncbi:hypothetical protein CHUAL_004647 [Chamberlinius hualienensis]